MNTHDPYGPMLAELSEANDADTDDLFRESLRQTKPYVRELRKAYDASPSMVDFSCRHCRAAYLLAYFPHYIETVYHVLEQTDQDILQNLFNCEKLRACFLGAGPGPEVLGLLAYLQDHAPSVQCVIAYLLDKHIDGWRVGQEITRYHLAPVYWPDKKLITKPLPYDFLNKNVIQDPFVERTFNISDLFVMQNCLNDQINQDDVILQNFIEIFRNAHAGALFIIADLNFDSVRTLMRRIETQIMEQRLGNVVLRTRDQKSEFSSKIITPAIIRECLLDGADRLVPKRHTRYYACVLQRTEG